MSKNVFALFLVAALAAPVVSASSAVAQIYYPWCANYSGEMGGASNCGFTTRAQCMATVSGIGGFCDPNPFYTGTSERPAKRAARRHAG